MVTRILLPESAIILTSCHGYPTFQGEFSYYVVLDTSSEDLNALQQRKGISKNASNSPSDDWKKGPIPQALQSKSTIADVLDDEFQSSDIWYATSPGYFQLMILDPVRNRVIYEYSID